MIKLPYVDIYFGRVETCGLISICFRHINIHILPAPPITWYWSYTEEDYAIAGLTYFGLGPFLLIVWDENGC